MSIILKEIKMSKVDCMEQDSEIPSLSLFGKWLSDAGFKPDDSAMITVYPGTLIIRQVINDKVE
jgi:hypothetical protein